MNDKRRRTARKRPDMHVRVTDTMTGESVGHIGNLSIDGMMLIAQTPIADDALYQFQFELPAADGRSHPIEVGVHQLWSDSPAFNGRAWVGFRFIDLAQEQESILAHWLSQAQDFDS